MTSLRTWWERQSEVERFRTYTRLTSELAIAIVTIAMAASAREPWRVGALLSIALAAVLLLESRPELTLRPTERQRRLYRRTGEALLLGVVVLTVTTAHLAAADATRDAARGVGVLALWVGAMTIVSFLERRWWVMIVASVAVGVGFGGSARDMATTAALALGVGAFMVSMTALTLWALHLVEDLERARGAEAELQVAEERLRFARDLHDVVGRGFSTVAVKSELASALSRAGEAERATAEMEEVKTLAVESMEQMRALVRGYRSASLADEVAGARSLLSAARCHLTVEGSPDRVPLALHEAAAWVVREGTTNIVKHTSATAATLSLGSDGMSLTNDDASVVGEPRSGQRGLAERLAVVGASMSTAVEDGRYVLRVRWETP